MAVRVHLQHDVGLLTRGHPGRQQDPAGRQADPGAGRERGRQEGERDDEHGDP